MKAGECGIMDGSLKTYLSEDETRNKELAELANLITNYAMEHCFSFSTVMKSVGIVRSAFMQAAIIKKAE